QSFIPSALGGSGTLGGIRARLCRLLTLRMRSSRPDPKMLPSWSPRPAHALIQPSQRLVAPKLAGYCVWRCCSRTGNNSRVKISQESILGQEQHMPEEHLQGTTESSPPPTVPGQFSVDSSQLSTAYANFCRVTGTPEELVLDFGLNTQMTPQPSEPVKLT